MDDYIKRKSAVKLLLSQKIEPNYPFWYADLIRQIPAEEVRPCIKGEITENLECSTCGRPVRPMDYYCWYCGTEFVGVKE